MEYRDFSQLTERVRACGKRRVAVAAAHDEHALDAVLKASEEGFVHYSLVGDKNKIHAIAETLGYRIDDSLIVDVDGSAAAAAAAVALVCDKKADFLMKGKLETADLMRAVLDRQTGIRTDSTVSHIAIFQIPSYHKLLAVTDGGMIPYPTFEQKKLILKNAIDFFHALGYEQPKVAVLAASETVNERMPETGDGKALAELAEAGAFGSCVVDGPLSFDLSVDRESAAIKGRISPVNADVDIMLVPNIAAGNILGKSFVHMAGALMTGCMIGAKAPIVLTSRGASAQEKRLALLLSSLAANHF